MSGRLRLVYFPKTVQYVVYNIPNSSCLEAVRPADTFACPRSSTNVPRHRGRANAQETKVIMAAVTYDCPLGYVGCALTRPAAAWSGLNTPSSRRDAFRAGLKGQQGFAGERQYRCLGPRCGPAVPNRRLQGFHILSQRVIAGRRFHLRRTLQPRKVY